MKRFRLFVYQLLNINRSRGFIFNRGFSAAATTTATKIDKQKSNVFKELNLTAASPNKPTKSYSQLPSSDNDDGKEDWHEFVYNKLKNEFRLHSQKQKRERVRERATKTVLCYILDKNIRSLLDFANDYFEKEGEAPKSTFNNEIYLLIIKFVKTELDLRTAKPDWTCSTNSIFSQEGDDVKSYIEKSLILINMVPQRKRNEEIQKAIDELLECLKTWITQLKDANRLDEWTTLHISLGIAEKNRAL